MRGRLEKVQKETFSIKEEINNQEDLIQRKKQDLEWKSKELINQEKQKEEFENLLRELNASKGEQDAMKILMKQYQQQQEQVKDI